MQLVDKEGCAVKQCVVSCNMSTVCYLKQSIESIIIFVQNGSTLRVCWNLVLLQYRPAKHCISKLDMDIILVEREVFTINTCLPLAS